MQPTAAATEMQHQYIELLPPEEKVHDTAKGAVKTAYGGPLGNAHEGEQPYNESSPDEGVYDTVYEVPLPWTTLHEQTVHTQLN